MEDNVVESQLPQGQPDTDLEATGQATDIEQTGGEPTGVEGLPEDWTPETLKDRWNDYKNLQTEFGKRSEASKEFDTKFQKYGGADRLLELADYLDGNEGFAEWVKTQQQAEVLGANVDDLDDDTKRAMDIVQGMSKAEIERMYQEKVAPLENHLKEQTLAANVATMSDKFENFNDMRETMAELAKGLPENIQDNPSLDDMENLYWAAMGRSGKFEELGAKTYEAKLEKAKKQSMDAPTKKAAPSRLTGKLSLAQAYEEAKAAIN